MIKLKNKNSDYHLERMVVSLSRIKRTRLKSSVLNVSDSDILNRLLVNMKVNNAQKE